MSVRETGLRIARAAGALVGYAGVASFLGVIGLQVYRWFRAGSWTHIGVLDALRDTLAQCCTAWRGARMAALSQWIDTPLDWLGLHQALEVLPASLALFVLSIIGNWLRIYCDDRLEGRAFP